MSQRWESLRKTIIDLEQQVSESFLIMIRTFPEEKRKTSVMRGTCMIQRHKWQMRTPFSGVRGRVNGEQLGKDDGGLGSWTG